MAESFREILKAVGTGPKGSRGLSADEAQKAFEWILSGKATPAQTGGMLLAIRTKGETAGEMEGFLRCLQHFCHVPAAHQPVRALDLGSPYDGHVRNPGLWIPAAIMAAAAGQKIILHGFQHLPAKFGVGLIPVWKEIGMSLSDPSRAREDLEKNGIICLSQQDAYPDLAAIAPLRGELGLRTIINTVEKAANPLNATHMAVGYYHETILDAMNAMISGCHPKAQVTFVGGQEGSVGLFGHRPTKTAKAGKSGLIEGFFAPPPEKPEPLSIEATTGAHARYIREVLSGTDHPHRKALLWQAATFLILGETAPDLDQAIERIGDLQHRVRW